MIGVYLFGGILVLLILVVVFAAVRASVPEPGEGRQLTQLEVRDAALEALRELEFDYQTGKLPEEEYQALRGELALAAVRAREAVARLQPPLFKQGPAEPRATVPCRVCGTDLEAEARFCAACGAPREAPT